jgi:hypothetical protein
MRRVLLLAALLVAPPLAAQGLHVLVVTGLGGEPSYSASFATAGAGMVDAARGWGVPATRITWLAEDTTRDAARVRGRSTKSALDAAFSRLGRDTRRGDTVLVVLIGHGSGEGTGSRVSLPGPDPTAADLGRSLDALTGRVLVVVLAASGSGDFLPALSRPGRIVITATRSATERNESLFGARWVQGLASGEADADKDGRSSVLESFLYAKRAVERVYEDDKRLLTEHAQLDDDGDGRGSGTPGADGTTDGALARRVTFGGRARPTDPRVAALVTERAALEAEVEQLRRLKDTMREAAYLDALEGLLVRIAEKTAAIRAATGGGAP